MTRWIFSDLSFQAMEGVIVASCRYVGARRKARKTALATCATTARTTASTGDSSLATLSILGAM
jgi:uncharacterized lipoprotein NlpE involved in copper resistance